MARTIVRWKTLPPIDQIYADIYTLERRIKNPLRPLQYSKQIFIRDVKEAFRTQSDPITGKPWPPWSKNYEGGIAILRLTTKLYRAATAFQNYKVTKRGVYLNTKRMPFYWRLHQEGRKKTDDLPRMPRRRYLGPSPEAEAQMVGVFDDWAKDAIIIYRRGRTLVKRNR